MKKKIIIASAVIISIVLLLNFSKIKFVFNMLYIYLDPIKSIENNKNSEKSINNPLKSLSEDPKHKSKDKKDNIPYAPTTQKSNDNNSLDVSENEVHKDYAKSNVNIKDEHNTKIEENQSIDVKKKTLIDIATKYNKRFEALQTSYLNDLDNLISEASIDYNKGDLSASQIASKYISKGTDLEKSCDKKINSILKELENELTSNGHDTSLVQDVKSYYNSFKKNKKSDLLDKAKEYR